MGSLVLWRALHIALVLSCARALTTLSTAAGDEGDCALYLNGPGRTSAYDYSLNLLKGNFNYEGQHTCITYDAINQAYLEARSRIVVSQPKGDWKAEDFASVGELILDISINLARRYGLTYEEIEKGLPLIDTSRTLIRDVCPPVFSHVECRAGKYRRQDGLCNNLQHPTWGSTMAPFQRLIGPLFSDGINAPRIGHTGRDLPLSRVVSRTMHPDQGYHDHAGTVMVIAWGQFMDHDYTLTGTPLDPINRNDPEECCKRPPHLKHPYCNEIRIPDDDYFYRLWGVKCIDFVRAFPSPRPGCRLGSRVPFNTLTGTIDGNTVYGVTDKFARKLRTGFGGLLRMNPVFKEYGLRDLLPLKLDIPDEGCTRPNKNMYCFEAGEIRVNEQLVLTVMHTLMAREHNRIAKALAAVNPHWDDETLFQESRRINVAEIQHITYNEFLPILLGKDVMEKFGLVVEKEGYWDGYDPHVNPDVIDAFASAAFRFGHSLLPTAVERWSKAHKFIASKRLSDLIRRPFDLYRAGVLDEYVMGLMNQVAQAMDDSITQEVTNHLFKKVGARFGMDLVSFNMQRGREFGIPGYMEFRKFCGLAGANSFQELFGSMPNETVLKYESIFEHPIDVDLWSGGVSERPLPGSMLGPTFACIIATQFSYSRRGDRFWYELPNQPSSFTPEQLHEIRKARLARVICDNTDIIDTVQLYPMVLPDHELNPRVPCRSGIIPSMDFSKWAEPAPFHGPKPFVTEALMSLKNETEENETTVVVNIISDQNVNNTGVSPDNEAVEIAKLVETNTPNVIGGNNCTLNETDCSKSNEKSNKDIIIKYVYQNDEKNNIPVKPSGHKKNSLRRKRSASISASPVVVNYETNHDNYIRPPFATFAGKYIKNKDLADFNIETLHKNKPYVQNTDRDTNLNEPNTQGDRNKEIEARIIVTDDDLPQSEDSSTEKIDTLEEQKEENKRRNSESREHQNDDKNSSEESNEENDNNDSRDSSESKESYRADGKHDRSNESFHIDSQERKYKENQNSDERNSNKETYSGDSSQSYRPSEKNIDFPNSKEKIVFDNKFKKPHYGIEKKHNIAPYGRDSYSNSKEESDSREVSQENSNSNQESQEKSSIKEDTKSIFKNSDSKTPNSQSTETDDSREGQRKNNNKTKSVRPVDESEEEVIAIITKKNRNPDIRPRENYLSIDDGYNNKSSPLKLKDVDLGDFTYERIHVNDKGLVEPLKDAHEDYQNPDIITPLTTFQPQIEENSKLQLQNPIPSSNIPYISESSSSEENKSSVQIDDGEVKPVVEIISDKELSIEDGSKEELKDKPNEDTSLETLLGVKLASSDETNEKLTKNDEINGSVDVKQQFERIPLNYNHVQKQQEQNDDTSNEHYTNNRESKKAEPGSENISEDKVPVKYDENLNIKFDDTPIKLPEIKLPEDILNFPYDKLEKQTLYNKKDEPEDKFYRYDEHEYNNDEPQGHVDHDDHEPSYYNSYYGKKKKKNAYKKKPQHQEDEDNEDSNEDEDLYEKFVRERFGKRGTFKERSAKLSLPPEPAKDNAQLFKALHTVLAKAQNIEREAQKSGDPKAGYAWTVEYGQNL